MNVPFFGVRTMQNTWSDNIIGQFDPLVVEAEDDIYGVVTELRFDYNALPKIKMSITAHLYSEKNIQLSDEETKKYLDIVKEKVKNYVLNEISIVCQEMKRNASY